MTLQVRKRIVNDLVRDVANILINKEGTFKIKDIKFDEKSLNAIANYIFNAKVMQECAKNKLKDKIYSMFSKKSRYRE